MGGVTSHPDESRARAQFADLLLERVAAGLQGRNLLVYTGECRFHPVTPGLTLNGGRSGEKKDQGRKDDSDGLAEEAREVGVHDKERITAIGW